MNTPGFKEKIVAVVEHQWTGEDQMEREPLPYVPPKNFEEYLHRRNAVKQRITSIQLRITRKRSTIAEQGKLNPEQWAEFKSWHARTVDALRHATNDARRLDEWKQITIDQPKREGQRTETVHDRLDDLQQVVGAMSGQVDILVSQMDVLCEAILNAVKSEQ